MGTVGFHRHFVPGFSVSFPFSRQPKLGTSIFFLKGIADGSQKGLPCLKVSCKITDGNRGNRLPRRKLSNRNTQKVSEKDIKDVVRLVHSAAKREENSVGSKKRFSYSNEKSSASSESKRPAAQFLENFLRDRKQAKDETGAKDGNDVLSKALDKVTQKTPNGESNLSWKFTQIMKNQNQTVADAKPTLVKEGNGASTKITNGRKQETPNSKSSLYTMLTQSPENRALADAKATRPRSSFVKRSPIPKPTRREEISEKLSSEASLPAVAAESEEIKSPTLDTEKVKLPELSSEALPTVAAESEEIKSPALDTELSSEALPTVAAENEEIKSPALDIDKMKVPELRELAKSKGIKFYYKLKKKELLEMLKPQE